MEKEQQDKGLVTQIKDAISWLPGELMGFRHLERRKLLNTCYKIYLKKDRDGLKKLANASLAKFLFTSISTLLIIFASLYLAAEMYEFLDLGVAVRKLNAYVSTISIKTVSSKKIDLTSLKELGAMLFPFLGLAAVSASMLATVAVISRLMYEDFIFLKTIELKDALLEKGIHKGDKAPEKDIKSKSKRLEECLWTPFGCLIDSPDMAAKELQGRSELWYRLDLIPGPPSIDPKNNKRIFFMIGFELADSYVFDSYKIWNPADLSTKAPEKEES